VRRQRARQPIPRRGVRLTGLVGALLLTATLVLGVSPAVDAAPNSELQRYAYLTDLVGGSVTVNWATVNTGSTTGTVKWGPAGGSCTENTANATKISISVNGVSRWQWQAPITGLAADTQ
jgi:hypothetical protein